MAGFPTGFGIGAPTIPGATSNAGGAGGNNILQFLMNALGLGTGQVGTGATGTGASGGANILSNPNLSRPVGADTAEARHVGRGRLGGCAERSSGFWRGYSGGASDATGRPCPSEQYRYYRYPSGAARRL